MVPISYDLALSDDQRRQRLYAGELFVYAPSEAAKAFCAFAREMIEDAFDGLDPETAQARMPVERYAQVLADLKPRFIHDKKSKEFVREMLRERGCDLDATYFDVPRMRSSTSDGYLTTGIALAWHPHRDTWYSAPLAQINWWLPIYDIEAGNAMAFHTGYFDRAVPNNSHEYNYYEWNAKHRRAAAANLKQDDRPLPRPSQPIDPSKDIVIVTPVGGVQMFSGAQLHSSVPNNTGKTRFSIDFRTVHIGDIAAGRSAPNVDCACTGSSIRDFLRARDFAAMPEEIVSRFNDGTEEGAQELLYGENIKSAVEARASS